jgi:hypothetical protein
MFFIRNTLSRIGRPRRAIRPKPQKSAEIPTSVESGPAARLSDLRPISVHLSDFPVTLSDFGQSRRLRPSDAAAPSGHRPFATALN